MTVRHRSLDIDGVIVFYREAGPLQAPVYRGWIAGVIIQNANAYEEGLSVAAAALAKLRFDTPGAVDRVAGLLTLAYNPGFAKRSKVAA